LTVLERSREFGGHPQNPALQERQPVFAGILVCSPGIEHGALECVAAVTALPKLCGGRGGVGRASTNILEPR
jgi:hypothetical protein